MTTYNDFTVPYGTTVTRLMTDTERKHEQRHKHAAFVVQELQRLNENHKLDPINLRYNGTRMKFSLGETVSYLQLTYDSGYSHTAVNLLHSDMQGQHTTVKMFANWNPTVCARILKLAKKQVADRRAQTAKKYSPFSDTIEYHESFA
jgi:hypothetical protein